MYRDWKYIADPCRAYKIGDIVRYGNTKNGRLWRVIENEKPSTIYEWDEDEKEYVYHGPRCKEHEDLIGVEHLKASLNTFSIQQIEGEISSVYGPITLYVKHTDVELVMRECPRQNSHKLYHSCIGCVNASDGGGICLNEAQRLIRNRHHILLFKIIEWMTFKVRGNEEVFDTMSWELEDILNLEIYKTILCR